MIVLLKNNWFDGFKWYDKGRVEYNGPKELLPSDHVILSEDGTLPVASNSPKAGFGAKPIEEQIMDLVGMGPTHQISFPSDSPKENLTDEEIEEREAQALENRKAAAQVRKDESDAALVALQQETETGIAAAQAAFELVQPTIDPLAAVQETGPVDAVTEVTPTKDKASADPFAKTKK